MEHGVVKSFDKDKGFGFIILDDGTEAVSYTHLTLPTICSV